MKFPISKISSKAAKLGVDAGKKLVENEYFLPIVYLTGAAGGLAYGTYALVNHLRERAGTPSAGDIAKIGVPVVVGSGLAFLGVRDLRAGKPLAAEAVRGSRGRQGTAKRGGRGRRTAAKTSAK